MAVLTALAPGAVPAIRGAYVRLHAFSDSLSLPVYLIRFDASQFHPEMFTAAGMDWPERIAKSVRRRQAEFFFGRLAARAGMTLQGFRPHEVPIGPQRQPLWPDGVTGSISHSETLAAAIVAPAAELSGVGIDIETVVNTEEMRVALLGTAIDAREFAYLQTLQCMHDMDTLLTLAFSAKEALFKGAFGAVGRYFDFTAARIRAIDAERGLVELVLQETLSGEFLETQTCLVGYQLLLDNALLTGFAW